MMFSKRSRAGSALVVILPILAILAVIIVTILSIALFDHRLSSSSFAQAQAATFAKYAIDDVSEKLQQIPLDRHWAAGPGRIRYWDGSSGWTQIDLHSGAPATAPAPAASYLDGPTGADAASCVQLNVPLSDGSYSIMPANAAYPSAPDMTVKWIYVLQDGTIQTDPTKLPNQGVVGRYAYWTDVENGRVNINTAGLGMVNGPPNPGSTTNPTGRFQWNVENWSDIWSNPISWGTFDTTDSYAANVWTPNPWISDRVTINSSGVSFPALDRAAAQKNTIQNLTAHPSSIDLSFLDSVSVGQSFNTFRYAGSYFLRVDARNSYAYFTGGISTDVSFSPAPNPDLSIRFFNDPSDWQLVVDAATYQRNKGYITVKGRTPEINPWGLPKIPLSLASKDGHALNDLTEYYARTVAGSTGSVGIQGTEDSRLTQVPKLNSPSVANATRYPALVAPPYPIVPSRSNFRDLANVYYPNSNYNYVAQLIYDLKNVLTISCPGFGTSLADKYNAYGTSGGEAEQVAVEMMTFVDSCLNNFDPGYAIVTPQVGSNSSWPGISPYGLTAPMMAGGSTRRQGTSGQFLINEIAMTAGPVTYAQAYGGNGAGSSKYYALTPKASPAVATNMQVTLPRAIETSYVDKPALLVLVRQPKDNPSGTGGSLDHFIGINLQAEIVTPPHWGFAPPLAGNSRFLNNTTINPCADLENMDVQWSTDGKDWSANDKVWNIAHFDVSGYQKVAGTYTLNADVDPVYTSDNPIVVPSTVTGKGRGIYETVKSFATPALSPNASTNPYLRMTPSTPGASIVVGPFDPTQIPTVSLKIRARIHFDFGISSGNPYVTTAMIPGIFPDFIDGWPGVDPKGDPATDPKMVVDKCYWDNSGKTDPNDPNDPSISQNWLEFDFKDVPVGTGPTQTVSYEATDPRVTRHASDWKLSTDSDGTLGAINSTYPSTPPDDSKLARPPSFWQAIRGPIRAYMGYVATSPVKYVGEIQTASRILGLPGVGYLSEVPTGVDTGLAPATKGTLSSGAWSTMKFNSTASSDPPPDWLLWNLFYVPFDRSISNQTDGKLNINAKLYPFKDSSGNDLVREKPLEALLGNRVANPTALANAIAAGPTYTNGTSLPNDLYVYAGQICQIPGVADASTGSNEYDREYLTRDLADIVTTQCSDYRVFVVAQTLKQSPTGQITPVSTQRVETTLSRVVDMGRQNYAFGENDSGPKTSTVPYPFNVYLRNAYRPSSSSAPVPSAARVDVQTPAAAGNYALGLSPLGFDHVPNTSDDWLIPQKIETSSYKVIK